MARPLNDSEYLYGLHDPGGEHIMLSKGINGWVLATEGIGFNRNDGGGGDYRYLSDRGLGVIVRLNAGYGGIGTTPFERSYGDFAQRSANFVRASQGAHIWIIGNEMNHPIEWPGADWDWGAAPPAPRPGREGEKIMPERYARCYRAVRDAIHGVPGHENDQVLVGGVAPWNNLTQYPGNENGDWIVYFQDILKAIGAGNCDGITLHTYTHGPELAKIDAETRMGPPFQHRRYEFRTYIDFMEAIPADMKHLPVYITETDQDHPWTNENTSWVRRAYGEIDYWNKNHAQQIRALLLYRWPQLDKWFIDGKQGVIEDFKQAMDWKLKWNPAGADTQPQPGQTYRAQIELPQPPSSGNAGASITIPVKIRNIGSDKWGRGGANPVRLGYRWYDASGQQVATADYRTPLPRDLGPNEEVQVNAQVGLPSTAGTYTITFDMVHEGITWFVDKGSSPAKARVPISGEAAPTEQYFPETKVRVRGAFLNFYRRYGLDICGYPITEEFTENGLKTQYFQRLALEEPAPGQVRLKLAAENAFKAEKRIAALESQIASLQRRLQGGGGLAPQPEMEDIVDSLPRDPAKLFTRPESDIKYIVINHTAVQANLTALRIAQAHRKSWPAIVCQFYIDGEGKISQTNRLTEVVDDKQEYLRDAINVHVSGNFSGGVPSPNQLDSLAALCAWLLDNYGLENEAVKGAREFVVTQSPGNNWTAGQKWKDMLMQRVEPLRGSGSVTEPGDGASAAQLARLQRERAALAEQLLDATTQVSFLSSRVAALEAALQQGGLGGVSQPPVRDIITELPRNAARMIKRRDEDIQFIVINHTAVPASIGVDRVAKAHAARWPAIVCQFYVDGDGNILQTNPINEVVDNKQAWILNGVNIHVAGNFNDAIPTDAQLDSLAHLAAWLMATYELTAENIKGVREFIVTQSPGDQWQQGQNWKKLLLERLATVPTGPGSGSGTGADQAVIVALRQQIALLTKQNQDLGARLREAQEQINNLPQGGNSAELQRQISRLEADKRALEQDQRSKQGAIDSLTGQITQKDAALAAKDREIGQLKAENVQLKAENARLKAITPGPYQPGQQPGVITKPPMEELVEALPRHATNRYERRPLSQITAICVHHSAAPANVTPERIAQYHVGSHGWAGMGYHYYIGPDGAINHTQDLEVVSNQVANNNSYTLGICVAGNFTTVVPTPAQIDATARLIAWLTKDLNISLDNVKGHREYPKNATACPGNQWLSEQKWKKMLFDRIDQVQSGQAQGGAKTIDHYLLFWDHQSNWAQADFQGAANYIAKFRPTTGFSVADAMSARRVTIVGGVAGVSQQAEDEIRASGSQVERLAGADFNATKAMLDGMAASGQRFRTL